MKPDWEAVETVFLDLDGTLLDLRFDNHFWLEYLPLRYAERHGLEPEAARVELISRYRSMEGRLEWYCLDYWSRDLGIEIAEVKREVAHRIAVRPRVPEFLKALRRMGKRLVLATNAHKLSLELKLAQTGLGCYFDARLCAHELAIPKEDPRFWVEVQGCEPYEPLRTMLIDDNLAVLESARMNSIRYLYGVVQPDSGGPARESGAYPLVGDFREILPAGDPDHAASATP